jgi:hypothetical protein
MLVFCFFKINDRGWWVAQVVKHFLRKCKVLSLNPSTTKKKKNKLSSWALEFKPVIIATWEAETSRITV